MSWDRDDEIGYGKPPRYTQFRKGRSGNPQGRPKRSDTLKAPPATDFDDVVRDLSEEKLVIKIGGRPQTIKAAKAVALRQRNDALNGSVTAQREFMRNKEKVDERDAQRTIERQKAAEQEALDSETHARALYDDLVNLHADQVEVYREAELTGQEPDPAYPHPDDFKFDHHTKTATIHGPWDEETAQHWRRIAKQRDFHLLDYAVLSRQRPRGTKWELFLASLQMGAFDAMLPNRQRVGGDGLDTTLHLLFAMPMADLRDWRKDTESWLMLRPQPEPSKKDRKAIYKAVNTQMKPLLKPLGFRSLAQFERHCEDQRGE